MILVDTSVWVDFFWGHSSRQCRFLETALDEDRDLGTCGPVLTEVFQGRVDRRQADTVRARFQPLIHLPLKRDAFMTAADIYRSTRVAGKTVRNALDCVIAACAIRHDASLLHCDRDFDVIADVADLKVEPS